MVAVATAVSRRGPSVGMASEGKPVKKSFAVRGRMTSPLPPPPPPFARPGISM